MNKLELIRAFKDVIYLFNTEAAVVVDIFFNERCLINKAK